MTNEKLREQFEALAINDELDITINLSPYLDTSYYDDSDTEIAWFMYKAGHAACEATLAQSSVKTNSWNCNDINAINCNSNSLEQFCEDNIHLAPFFAMLATALSKQSSVEPITFSESDMAMFQDNAERYNLITHPPTETIAELTTRLNDIATDWQVKQLENAKLNELIKLKDEALLKIANGNARTTPKNDECEHKKYGYEDCESCISTFAEQALALKPTDVKPI